MLPASLVFGKLTLSSRLWQIVLEKAGRVVTRRNDGLREGTERRKRGERGERAERKTGERRRRESKQERMRQASRNSRDEVEARSGTTKAVLCCKGRSQVRIAIEWE